MLKRFSAAKKVKMGPENDRFFLEYKDLNIKYRYHHPQKALRYPQRRLFWKDFA